MKKKPRNFWSRKKPDNGRIVAPREQRDLLGLKPARLSREARVSLAQIGATNPRETKP